MATIRGDDGSNRLEGPNEENDFLPGLGNDTIIGGNQFDTIVYSRLGLTIRATFTGEGSGTVEADNGKRDTFFGIEQIVGGGNNDTFINQGTSFVRFRGQEGTDTYIGSAAGVEQVDFRQDAAGVIVNLGEGFAVDGYGNREALTLIDEVRASLFADTIVGSDGANAVRGLDGNDDIRGLGGNDELGGNLGNDRIDGGEGTDFAYIDAARAASTVTRNGSSNFTITSSDGTDTLLNIERLIFNDQNFAIDTGAGQTAGFAYRIYQAAFDRAPDAGGLSFYIDLIDGGRSFSSIAQNFVNSPEFASVYGANATNEEFIGRLYQNVLGRAGEAGGVAFYMDVLTSGKASRADVLAGFAESPENVALVAPAISEGFAYG
ncbi:DUF4214 domain-containing protein [Antarcticirhabdus aurantiaca]|uniref:DUF4214 domain-containing protein n=1 Tax=Antarcticirhabdus aurantiaca TaxID=2606717 RepID=A0ACD4NQK8_9HYPH|nr:DUF4214 domain-containing protein [Antarcticirhabdus aurantiaca]WAJ28940.1 DUF4214 domain-containing protein [Jeongeuplla avenae]